MSDVYDYFVMQFSLRYRDVFDKILPASRMEFWSLATFAETSTFAET